MRRFAPNLNLITANFGQPAIDWILLVRPGFISSLSCPSGLCSNSVTNERNEMHRTIALSIIDQIISLEC